MVLHKQPETLPQQPEMFAGTASIIDILTVTLAPAMSVPVVVLKGRTKISTYADHNTGKESHILWHVVQKGSTLLHALTVTLHDCTTAVMLIQPCSLLICADVYRM